MAYRALTDKKISEFTTIWAVVYYVICVNSMFALDYENDSQ